MAEITTPLDDAQTAALDRLGIDPSYVDECISGTRLHKYMVGGEAWLDGEHLIFVGHSNEQRFMYYMGEERNQPVLRVGDLSVYELDDERIEWLTDRPAGDSDG